MANRAGSDTWRATAASTARVAGQRRSPWVCRRQAGCRCPASRPWLAGSSTAAILPVLVPQCPCGEAEGSEAEVGRNGRHGWCPGRITLKGNRRRPVTEAMGHVDSLWQRVRSQPVLAASAIAAGAWVLWILLFPTHPGPGGDGRGGEDG